MSKFKLGLTIIFSLFIVIALIIFAASKGTGSGPVAPITIWGYMSQDDFNNLVRASTLHQDKTVALTYVQKSQTNFENDFIGRFKQARG